MPAQSTVSCVSNRVFQGCGWQLTIINRGHLDSRHVFGLAGCLLGPATQFMAEPVFIVGVFDAACRRGAVPDPNRMLAVIAIMGAVCYGMKCGGCQLDRIHKLEEPAPAKCL